MVNIVPGRGTPGGNGREGGEGMNKDPIMYGVSLIGGLIDLLIGRRKVLAPEKFCRGHYPQDGCIHRKQHGMALKNYEEGQNVGKIEKIARCGNNFKERG